MRFVKHKEKFHSPLPRAIFAGVIVFLLLALVDQASRRLGMTVAERLGDDALGGVIVGSLTFVNQRRRNRYLAERLRVIALMNHHIRNSLQTIKFAGYTHQDVKTIDEAVARIEWALREILPGGIDAPGATFPPAKHPSGSYTGQRTA